MKGFCMQMLELGQPDMTKGYIDLIKQGASCNQIKQFVLACLAEHWGR